MEINVNCLVSDLDPFDLSASKAERGNNAGPETWRNALTAADGLDLDGFDVERAKAFFAGFGAWEREEIASWTRAETLALVLQYAAGDLRELQALAPGEDVADIDWSEAEQLAEQGVCSGNLFPHDGELWISLD